MSADDVVRAWRAANSLERDADFAFFWDYKHEAAAEAGQMIADAWEFCRLRVSQGLGSTVKDLLALEEVPLPVYPAEAKSKAVIATQAPKSVAKRLPKPSANPRYRPTFEAVEARDTALGYCTRGQFLAPRSWRDQERPGGGHAAKGTAVGHCH